MPDYDSPGGLPRLDLHASLPLDQHGTAAAADVLEGIGDGSHAFWGVASPFRASVEIGKQVIHPPEIPHRLGWLNYWSAAAAKAIGRAYDRFPAIGGRANVGLERP